MKLKLFGLFLLTTLNSTAIDQPKKRFIRRMSDRLAQAKASELIAVSFVPAYWGQLIHMYKFHKANFRNVSNNIESKVQNFSKEVETHTAKAIEIVIKTLKSTPLTNQERSEIKTTTLEKVEEHNQKIKSQEKKETLPEEQQQALKQLVWKTMSYSEIAASLALKYGIVLGVILTAKYLNKLARKYINIKDETPTDIEEKQLV